jgi:hypothetical protein
LCLEIFWHFAKVVEDGELREADFRNCTGRHVVLDDKFPTLPLQKMR